MVGRRKSQQAVTQVATNNSAIFWSLPGPAGRPEPTHVSSEYVDIKWTAPQSSGSSPILRYRITLRAGGESSEFEPVMDTEDATCVERVATPADSWCEFSVAAVSGGGLGSYSLPSVPVLTRGGARGGEIVNNAGRQPGKRTHHQKRRARRQREGRHGNVNSDITSGGGGLARGAGDGTKSGNRVQGEGAAGAADHRYGQLRAQLRAWEKAFEIQEGRSASEDDMAASTSYRRVSVRLSAVGEVLVWARKQVLLSSSHSLASKGSLGSYHALGGSFLWYPIAPWRGLVAEPGEGP